MVKVISAESASGKTARVLLGYYLICGYFAVKTTIIGFINSPRWKILETSWLIEE